MVPPPRRTPAHREAISRPVLVILPLPRLPNRRTAPVHLERALSAIQVLTARVMAGTAGTAVEKEALVC